ILEISDPDSVQSILPWPTHPHGCGGRITLTGALHGFEQKLQIRHGSRHRSHHTDEPGWSDGLREMSGRRDTARRGLESAYSAEVCGHANRSSAITAHATCRTSRSDGCGFPTARAARRSRQNQRIVSATGKKIFGLPCHEQFSTICCPENNRARVSQSRDQRRVLLSDVTG